jgi:hypothetical protein
VSTYPTEFNDRFAALAPEPVASDWLDVQRRVRASRKHHLIAYALAATFAIVLVGCTAVFGPRIVSFADSEPSPPWVFDELTVVRANKLDEDRSFPGFDEKQTRRVIDQEFANGTIEVDVTPLKGGGFCATSRHDYSLAYSDGTSNSGEEGGTDCVTPERRQAEPLVVQEIEGRLLSEGGRASEREGGAVSSLFGWVTAAGAHQLVLRYEDGERAQVDLFRVTEPIDASFFLFDVPSKHENYRHRAVELTARDDNGHVVARHPIVYYRAVEAEWEFPRWKHHAFPPAADTSLVRKLIFPRTDARIWLAPAKGGVTCFIFRQGSGQRSGSESCLLDAESRYIFRLDEDSFWLFGQDSSGRSTPLFWGLVEPQVRRVDLRFQDGSRDTTVPQEGFVLYAMPVRHHAPGKRLVKAVLRDAKGSVVRSIAFDPTIRDRYPCDNPKSDIEYGPEHCP